MTILTSFDDAALVVSAACRELRRVLRPVAWVVLEEVALGADLEDGRLLARTSARQVAERLGVDPGTAAGALRDLRRRGLLVLEREHGPAGRFGLSVYVLGSIAGLRILSPRMPEPGMGASWPENPGLADTDAGTPGVEMPDVEVPEPARPGTAEPSTLSSRMERAESFEPGLAKASATPSNAADATARATRSARSECSGQTALDLGSGSS